MINKLFKKILHKLGYDLLPIQKAQGAYFSGMIPYATQEQKKTIDFCLPYSQTQRETCFALIRATEYIIQNRIPGDFVECGVWKGGSIMAMAMTLDRLQETRDIYLFDTFTGMPSAESVDVDWEGNDEHWYREESDQYVHAGRGALWNAITLDEVKKNIAQLHETRQKFHYIKGLVEDTLPSRAPEKIALLRLDTDFHSSTKHELEQLYPRLVSGGVIIVDDYGHFLGARKAVDDYMATHPIKAFINRVDYTVIMWIKP